MVQRQRVPLVCGFILFIFSTHVSAQSSAQSADPSLADSSPIAARLDPVAALRYE